MTRRELMLFSCGSILYGASAWLTSVSARKGFKAEERLEKILDHRRVIDALADACYSRWRLNENYVPMKLEVRTWMETIIFYDEVIEDPAHYAALIDLESSGNPTVLVKRWNARGLGCVRHATAVDLVKRLGLKVKAVGSALFNPQFNILCMVKIFEECYAQAKGPGRIERALNYYIMGKARTHKHIAAGKEPDRYIDLYSERKEAISKLMIRRQR